jgi:hypothetical protein
VSALIAGIDLSSKRIDCALIPLDPDDGSDAPAVTLRSFDLPVFRPASTTPAYRRVERCRVIRDAMRQLLAPIEIAYGHDEANYYDVAHVCIEEPFGSVSRSTVLWEILGAILATIPSHIERDTIATHEWRRIIWSEHIDAGVWASCGATSKGLAVHTAYEETFVKMNEHEAEAYLIARACRTRLEKAVAA